MSVKFKKSKQFINWHGEKHEVDAYVCKGLMVHKIPQEDGNAKFVWTISHVQTGFSLGNKFPPFRIMKEAKEFTTELLEKDDWLVVSKYNQWRILKLAWKKLHGITYAGYTDEQRKSDKEDLPEREVKDTKCIKCGKESQRFALGMDNKGKFGWYNFCLKCFPYDEKILRVKGEMSHW